MEDEEKNRLRGGWSHHEESGVHHSPGCRDDLASSSVERLLSDDCVQDLKLDISDGWGQQKDWVMETEHYSSLCTILTTLDILVRRIFQHQWQHREQRFIPHTNMFQGWKERWENLRSSHRGPSLVPHWKPWTMLSLTDPSSALSTYKGRGEDFKS